MASKGDLRGVACDLRNVSLEDVALDDSPTERQLAAPTSIAPSAPATIQASDRSDKQAITGSTSDTQAPESGDSPFGTDPSSSWIDASTAQQSRHDDSGGFEAVPLDNQGPIEPLERGDGPRTRTHPSPAASSSPPYSPSLASTAPTTAIDLSSTTHVDTPPGEASTGVVSGPTKLEAPNAASSSKPTMTPAAPSPKKLVSTSRPTLMQKVVSMTRQRDLPPKPREEEEKHLSMLAEMYAASREADKQRREAEAQRAAVRAAQHAAAFPAWESSILPNWRVVLHETSEGRKLRKLWWDGTMPTRWRGRLWAMCIGNGLAVPKGAFTQAGQHAERLRQAGALTDVESAAREDVERTLPALHMFQSGAVMHDDLMEILIAWSVYEKASPRYPEGLAFPAALLLLNMTPPEAFVCLVNLVQKSFLRSFYGDQEEIEAYYRVFDTLLADAMPKIYANFSAQVVRPSLYLLPWLSTLFAAFLPLDLATRIFDVFLLEGDSFPFRVALVLLEILEPRLFNPNLDELAQVFAGTDRGALGVVRREKGLLRADGGVDPEGRVHTDEVYAEMGATEEHVFDGLKRLEWKEETWMRLVERELPEVV